MSKLLFPKMEQIAQIEIDVCHNVDECHISIAIGRFLCSIYTTTYMNFGLQKKEHRTKNLIVAIFR